MNAYPKPSLVAVTLALTAWTAPCQKQGKPQAGPATLAQAVVAEVYEHNLGKAMRLYDKIAKDTQQSASDRQRARLRLAKAHRRLGQIADAERILADVAKGGGTAAKEAKAILDGVVPTDGDLVRAKVEQVLKTMRLTGKPQTTELRWIGPAATPHVIQAVEAEKADLNFITNCTKVLVSIGGDSVGEWLGTVQKSEDTLRKRAVLKGSGGAPAALRPALKGFAKDADASVRKEFLTYAARDFEVVQALLDDADAGVAQLALDTVFGSWMRLEHGGSMVANFRSIQPRLERLESCRGSRSLGGWLGLVAGWKGDSGKTEERRKMVVEVLAYPCFRDLPLNWQPLGRAAARNHFADGVLAAATRIGPLPERNLNRPPRYTPGRKLATIVQDCLRHWDRESLPVVLKLVELGYCQEVRLGGWIAGVANRSDIPKIVERMFDFGSRDVTDVCNWMVTQGSLASVSDKLVPIADQMLRGNPSISQAAAAVLRAIAEVGTKESVDYCIERLRAGKFNLAWLKNNPSAPKQKLLEAVLSRPHKELNEHRSKAFHMLMTGYEQPGQPASFARAYELGLGSWHGLTNHYMGLPAREFGGVALCFPRSPVSMQHGGRKCDDATAAAILAACLERGGQSAFHDLGGNMSATDLGRPLVDAIAKHMLRAPAIELPRRRGETLRSRLVDELLPRYRNASDIPEEVRKLVVAGLADADPATRTAVAKSVPYGLMKDEAVVQGLVGLLADTNRVVVAAAAKRISRGSSAKAAVAAMAKQLFQWDTSSAAFAFLSRVAPERLDASIDRLLREGSTSSRQRAAKFWLERKGVDGFAKVGPLLTSLKSTDVVTMMGSSMDLGAVPHLLQALKSTALRTAAQNMLKSIRFYHEEKSKWNRLMAGSGFDTASAAEALVQQFNKSDSAAVRLAAIASLGTLGDAETLPFLVKLIGHEDADVRQAAQAAVDKINSRAPTKKGSTR